MRKAVKRYFTILLIGIICFCGTSSFAQDPQFSQFFVAPSYLNPSFAGSTDGSRAVMNYRNQWPAIPGAFVSTALSADHYFASMKSGVGLLFLNDKAGTGRLRSTKIAGQYTYNISINRQWSIRPGLQFSFTQRSIDFDKLIFGDQLTFNGPLATSNLETYNVEKKGYIDFATSAIVFSDKYWGGFVFDHILEPNQSLIGSASPIPMKLSIHGGVKLFLRKSAGLYEEEYISLVFNYRHQNKYDQLDLGGYWFRKPILLGIWYRGIPLQKNYKPGYLNHDALVVMAGIKFKQFIAGYSYDLTISRLFSNTDGAHEISIIYEFNQDQHLQKKRKKVVVPCPKI
ncbi:MAG TPA: hypothetical protein DEH02_19690 [Bacteroidales bacterium]|nr:hypothetical protein [Bacteroidales bacterium]